MRPRAFNSRTTRRLVPTLLLVMLAMCASGAVRYVNVGSATPLSPYTNWNTAARTIQAAIDVSQAGDEILVTNGVYRLQGRTYKGANRVALTRPVTLRSVNGPTVTLIIGQQVPGTTNGVGAIRCAYLTNGAMLIGFTLTNGATRTEGYEGELFGGGAYCESTAAIISNCVFASNSAYTLGGGAYGGTLNNCTLSGNSSYQGGGAHGAALNNCVLTGNKASFGGGASVGRLISCALTGNSAEFGGAARFATLINCTVAGNTASSSEGGVSACSLLNCIIYYNTAPIRANWADGSLDYCVTLPLPNSGAGNLDIEPGFATAWRLSANSPCVGKGTNVLGTGTDIDGEPWRNPPSIGCHEPYSGSLTGAVTVAFTASLTNVVIGFTVDFRASFSGQLSASRWEFADGTILSNRPYASHAWSAAGDYAVVLRAYNETYPEGVTASIIIRVVPGVHYVALDSATPTAPYTNWATAARTIQNAVDAASLPGASVLVSNGVYQAGGRNVYGMGNRLAINKRLRVQSVNGPQFTVIRGLQVAGTTNGSIAIRCVYLTNHAILSGFTLTNGATHITGDYREQNGGGVWCESDDAIVTNCVIVGNSAFNAGGGSYGGMLVDSTLASNWALQEGGGAAGSLLLNCALFGNSATNGGGVYYSSLSNCVLNNSMAFSGGAGSWCNMSSCVITGNSAFFSGGGVSDSSLTNCALTGNWAEFGGASLKGRLDNCTLADNSATWGGGAYGGTLNSCKVTGNWANWAGGAYNSALANCTLVGNSADFAGGTYYGTLYNCIAVFNTAGIGENYWYSTLDYCCTTPLPAAGDGNISGDPGFLDLAGGNLRLQFNSRCINSGRNGYAPFGLDLGADPRIAGGTVDIGAYEFQSPLSRVSYAWLQQYGFALDGSADFSDPDGDGANNHHEWITGTLPTNPLSLFRILSVRRVPDASTITWQSVSNKMYFVELGSDLGVTPPFIWSAGPLRGQSGSTSWTLPDGGGERSFFYRIRIAE